MRAVDICQLSERLIAWLRDFLEFEVGVGGEYIWTVIGRGGSMEIIDR